MTEYTPENDPPQRCEHPEVEPRMRTLSNGARAAYWQCLQCGAGIRAVGKGEYFARDAARHENEPFDPALSEDWQRRQEKAWEAYRLRKRARTGERSQAWWERYDAYIESEAWRRKADLRLHQDNFRCQARLPGCEWGATQVHHLTYRHLTNEPLFDLVSVCRSCHEQITSMDRRVDDDSLLP